jgi:hypothetical protein
MWKLEIIVFLGIQTLCMSFKKPFNPYGLLRAITLVTLAVMFLYGITVTVFEIKPFWLDEWCIIYNLKTKTHTELWGHLEYMQQFPRLYLQVIKSVTEPFDYSFSSLKVTSLIVHCTGLVFCYRLSSRLFGKDSAYRFFWVLLYASYVTSLEYFVQVKQYTMEMFLSLVAIWQLAELLKAKADHIHKGRYLLLCISCLMATFFSYTYPICFLSVVVVTVFNTKNAKDLLYRALPIVLGVASITIFYLKDVTQAMADPGMQDFWKGYTMRDGFELTAYLRNVYHLFSNIGTGLLFEIIFGALGICGALYGIGKYFRKREQATFLAHAVQYSTVLVLLMILLFSLHKLPLGAHRLNAFSVPAVSILVTNLLIALERNDRLKKAIPTFYSVLFLALTGNVYLVFYKQIWSEEAVKKQRIYENTKQAIILAESKHLPMATSTGVVYPNEDRNGDFAVMTYPVYHMHVAMPVHNANSKEDIQKLFSERSEINEIVFIDRYQHSIEHR